METSERLKTSIQRKKYRQKERARDYDIFYHNHEKKIQQLQNKARASKDEQLALRTPMKNLRNRHEIENR